LSGEGDEKRQKEEAVKKRRYPHAPPAPRVHIQWMKRGIPTVYWEF
jgi:hypothetical protein